MHFAILFSIFWLAGIAEMKLTIAIATAVIVFAKALKEGGLGLYPEYDTDNRKIPVYPFLKDNLTPPDPRVTGRVGYTRGYGYTRKPVRYL